MRLGTLTLPNRVAMAPMTRSRAGAAGDPTALMGEYYAQRASAGLIISEGVVVSPEGKGYPNTPGIFTEEQAEGWSGIVERVHEAGGRIFAQLWHVGRVSHPSLQPGGALPVAPSPLPAEGAIYTSEGMKPYPTPRELETGEIPGIVDEFRAAAVLAKRAGFDGVEIHGANGYLIDQFLRDGSNRRTDRYGGSLENRARLLLEVVQAVLGVFDADRVGVRIAPVFSMLGMHDSTPESTFRYVASALREFQLAYLHVVESRSEAFDWRALRRAFGGLYVANGGYDLDRARAAIEAGDADLVSFGSLFIANPDLVERFGRLAPLQSGDRATYYTGGAQGYTDYPALEAEAEQRVPVGAGEPA
jgi:N-ethylmaleimide reductase